MEVIKIKAQTGNDSLGGTRILKEKIKQKAD